VCAEAGGRREFHVDSDAGTTAGSSDGWEGVGLKGCVRISQGSVYIGASVVHGDAAVVGSFRLDHSGLWQSWHAKEVEVTACTFDTGRCCSKVANLTYVISWN
jgi:hypothetical protein